MAGSYNQKTGEIMLRFEAQGTQYEGRSPRIENIEVGTVVKLVREKDNQYDENALNIRNSKNESLGNTPADIAGALSPLIDAKLAEITEAHASYVEPLSMRSKRAKKAILYVEAHIKLTDIRARLKDGCLVCILGGDQVHGWFQELRVFTCDISLPEAKLLFELYNRSCGEYETIESGDNNLNYLGLDNLDVEVLAARKKMAKERVDGIDYSRGQYNGSFIQYIEKMVSMNPGRYGKLKKYVDPEYINDRFITLEQIFIGKAVDVKTYYWIDQLRVTPEEWDRETGYGFSHWYDVMELYSLKKGLPFDLEDEDIVSIFGFGKFEAFADLSYGC